MRVPTDEAFAVRPQLFDASSSGFLSGHRRLVGLQWFVVNEEIEASAKSYCEHQWLSVPMYGRILYCKPHLVLGAHLIYCL